ncbi:MAG: YggT family protein [Burkholderiales bacterium]|nr:YggT family protein [Pseudomonadota bacterium]
MQQSTGAAKHPVMLNQALHFLIDSIVTLFLIALLLRVYLQIVRASAQNPISHFVIALTDFAVRPLRRVVPGFRGYDVATLVLAWLIAFLLLLILSALGARDLPPMNAQVLGVFALLALVHLLRLAIYIVIGVVVLQAILSWVNPYSPLAPLLNSLSRPFLRPVQRVVPPVANVDLSPLIVLLICQLLLIVPVPFLERAIIGLS